MAIELLESDLQIVKKINKALAKEVNKTFKASLPKIDLRLKTVLRSSLIYCPEITSLSSGFLRLDFGLTEDPSSFLVSAIVDSLIVDLDPIRYSGNKIAGGIFIYVQPSSFANLLSLPIAVQAIENGAGLPWLKWLLTIGDQIVVADFGVEYGDFGRTGGAHMTVKRRPFKVNSAFSGTEDDNFITRAFNRSSSEIIKTIKEAV